MITNFYAVLKILKRRKKSHFLEDNEVESSFIRSASVKDMSSFRLKKKNHDDLNNTRSGNYGFVKHKNRDNARKQI